MTADLLVAAAAAWLLATVAGGGATRLLPLSIAGWTSAAGGGCCAAAGAALLIQQRTLTAAVGGQQVVGGLALRVHPLAGVFITLLGVVAVATGPYAIRYHHPGRGTALYLGAYNLALIASLAVLVAGNVPTFLVAWETMALLCYLLVIRSYRSAGVPAGGFWFLALSEIGFALIVAAFAILAARTGTLDFTTMISRGSTIGTGWRSVAYILALLGFGCKAGLVPTHVWLPEAHPVAPSDGSAFLSGLIVKLGVYGIALFGFQLLGSGPVWWGLVTMAIGALSAVLGILYALTEHDIKRFLAYSTIENVGVIVTALGAGLTFGAEHRPALAAFLLLAGLYHVGSHGIAKTLLFLSAGVIDHATGTREMDRLGGLIHRLPRTAVATLIGTMGIAALPPFGGFVSEWLIFQGMFQAFRIGSHTIAILVVAAAAVLGLTGGLAVAAFIRGFGIPFLGMPRTHAAAQAIEKGQPAAGLGWLAVLTVASGIGAPAILVALSNGVHATSGMALRPILLIGQLTVIPAHANFSAFSPTWLAVFILAMLAVPVVIYAVGRPRGELRVAPVWDGGITMFKPRMQYSAMTFSAPMRVTFSGLYRPTVHVERASDDPAGRSGPVHYEAAVAPIFWRYLYQPVVRAVEWLADLIRPIQSGNVNLYLLYVFVAVVIGYAVAAG